MKIRNQHKRLGAKKVINAKKASNPLKVDPTRTAGLRRSFLAHIRRRFALLRGRIVKLVVDEDAFGLKTAPGLLTGNYDPDQPREADGKWGSGEGSTTILDRQSVIKHIMTVNPPEQVRSGKDTPESWADRHLSDEKSGYTLTQVHPKSLNLPIEAGVPKNVEKYAKLDSVSSPAVVIDSNDKLQARYGGGKLDQAYGLQPHTVIDGKHRVQAAIVRGDKSIKAIVPISKLVEIKERSHAIELEEFAHKYASDKGHTIVSTSMGRHGPTVRGITKDGLTREWTPTDLERIAGKVGHKLTFNYDPSLATDIHAMTRDIEEPTQAQKEAGNYKMAHVRVQGLDLTIEVGKGQYRHGKGWSNKMAAHYGYIKRTESLADGDHVDVFLGPFPESEAVFIIDQVDLDGKFDEHKCMLGFLNKEDAKKAYLDSYNTDWKGFGGMTVLTMDQFKKWIHSDGTARPMTQEEKALQFGALPDGHQWRSVHNTRFSFHTDSEKIKAFQLWLKTQLFATLVGKTDEELWKAYILEGFKKGAGRAWDDTNKDKIPALLEDANPYKGFYAGTKEEFMRSSFAQPETVDKVKLLAGRSFDDLNGITTDMSNRISRSLMDGLVQGKNPRQIAKDMIEDVDVTENRALLIARTEIVRAHAEGQLDAFDALGVAEVGVAVEWSTAGDDRVCEECESMEGVVLSIDEAHGMLPRHANCRCAFIPANVGEKEDDQTRGQKGIEAAIKSSLHGDDEDGWAGRDASISKSRPESILNSQVDAFDAWLRRFPTNNSFCATGAGGGVDPTCSPGGSSGLSESELPKAPEFLDKQYAAGNLHTISLLQSLAKVGDKESLQKYASLSPKINDYKQQLIDKLETKSTAAKSDKLEMDLSNPLHDAVGLKNYVANNTPEGVVQ